MKLITAVEIPEYPFHLDHHQKILMLGSCFTENIGRKLERYRFPVEINPFGTIFNPLSVLRSMEALLNKNAYTTDDLEKHQNSWLSFDHYTGFSDECREKCLEKINRRFIPAKQALGEASTLILSWGTAWVYRKVSADGGQPVSNCHKIPAKHFSRSRLSPREITEAYGKTLDALFQLNPELRVLLTISPVRHLKDGTQGNQLSKACLLLATEELSRLYPDNVFYFPSYEIVMDELRDYRFYAEDMMHVNDLATGYIWEKFSEALLGDESQNIIRDLEALLRMREHRSSQTTGPAHEKLQLKMQNQEKKIQENYPDFLGRL